MTLLLVSLFIVACYKWGDWKNWKIYYSTILFLIVSDYIHYFITAAKPLWRYNSSIFPGVITQLFISLIVYPCTVLMFLPSFLNSGWPKRLVYVSLWVGIYSLLEAIGLKFNYFSHLNGWHFAYSFLFDWIIFTLIWVHQKNPPMAWMLSIIVGVTITLLFTIPTQY